MTGKIKTTGVPVTRQGNTTSTTKFKAPFPAYKPMTPGTAISTERSFVPGVKKR